MMKKIPYQQTLKKFSCKIKRKRPTGEENLSEFVCPLSRERLEHIYSPGKESKFHE